MKLLSFILALLLVVVIGGFIWSLIAPHHVTKHLKRSVTRKGLSLAFVPVIVALVLAAGLTFPKVQNTAAHSLLSFSKTTVSSTKSKIASTASPASSGASQPSSGGSTKSSKQATASKTAVTASGKTTSASTTTSGLPTATAPAQVPFLAAMTQCYFGGFVQPVPTNGTNPSYYDDCTLYNPTCVIWSGYNFCDLKAASTQQTVDLCPTSSCGWGSGFSPDTNPNDQNLPNVPGWCHGGVPPGGWGGASESQTYTTDCT